VEEYFDSFTEAGITWLVVDHRRDRPSIHGFFFHHELTVQEASRRDRLEPHAVYSEVIRRAIIGPIMGLARMMHVYR